MCPNPVPRETVVSAQERAILELTPLGSPGPPGSSLTSEVRLCTSCQNQGGTGTKRTRRPSLTRGHVCPFRGGGGRGSGMA